MKSMKSLQLTATIFIIILSIGNCYYLRSNKKTNQEKILLATNKNMDDEYNTTITNNVDYDGNQGNATTNIIIGKESKSVVEEECIDNKTPKDNDEAFAKVSGYVNSKCEWAYTMCDNVKMQKVCPYTCLSKCGTSKRPKDMKQCLKYSNIKQIKYKLTLFPKTCKEMSKICKVKATTNYIIGNQCCPVSCPKL